MTTKNLSLEKVRSVEVESMRGWDRLRPAEQQVVRKESDALLRTPMDAGRARLAIGEHLARLRDVLEPRKMFERYLKSEGLSIFKISRATAYRYINTYEAARTILPAPIMQVALMRPNDSLDLEMVRAHPAPRTTSRERIDEYLDSVSRRPRGEAEEDPETLQKECINFIRTRWNRLPSGMSKRQRNAWMDELRAMTLTLQGVSGPITIEASAIPDHYKAKPVGRPRKSGDGSSSASAS